MVVAIAMVNLFQTLIGTLGNFCLLYHYNVLYFIKCRLKFTDMIRWHLVVANSLAILSRGIPETMAAFGLKGFLSNLGCKLIFYLHRVGRGVSISTTCLLSVFQVITVSASSSRWVGLKAKALNYTGVLNILCWILHMLVNTIVLLYMTDKQSHENVTYKKQFGSCSSVTHQRSTKIFHAILLSLPDVVCVGLMLWASSSMVLILYKHRQRMRHICRTNFTPRSSPETRATKTILLLVTTFVSFYTLSSIFQAFFVFNDNPDWVLAHVGVIITGCYPIVSPFVLMGQGTGISSLCFSQVRNAGAAAR
ncbi:vomeronasal type-1 receptor 4-like [Ctenodactylus gundi]